MNASGPVVMVELRLRAIPERTQGASCAYRGRAELTFTSYALNDDELAVFSRELPRQEIGMARKSVSSRASSKPSPM